MLDAKTVARRTAALDEPAINSAAKAGVAIRLVAPRTRFSLRVDLSCVPPPQVVGRFALDLPINRFLATAEGTSMRLGPDEWLLSAPEHDLTQLADDIEGALAGIHHSLVDISHRNVALSVSGIAAADVIACGCPLDLSCAAFPVGTATRTLFGKTEIVLSKRDSTPTFEIECWRSFAAYVRDLLLEAARRVDQIA